MAPKKNILILTYFFPPCNKVGGRRWAKFGKYLSRRGYNISVLSVDFPHNGLCPWAKDVNSFKNNVFRLPYIEHRPYYRVNRTPTNISGKLKYKISLFSEKYSFKKHIGDPSDISSKYGKILLKQASEIIEQNQIETVIITGGPFHWCFEAIKLKKKYPDLHYIMDFRDFWTGGEAYRDLNQKNRSIEDLKELECIIGSDHIFSPAERIVTYLKNKYPLYSEKIKLLSHSFDKEEIPESTSIVTSPGNKISFAYGGILYNKMESSIQKLIELIKLISTKGIDVSLDIYTFNRSYENAFINAGLKNIVTYHDSIPPDQLFKIFADKDILLQLRAGESQEQHFKSTKFYELIALRKPIVYVGPEGDVGNFITSNSLGYDCNNDLNQIAAEIIENKKNNFPINKNFDVSKYEFETVTNILEEYL